MPISNPATRTSYVRWGILALLCTASFIAYVLRTNMSVAGVRMMGDLGISQMQLGIVLAGFAWGYAIFQFPGGVLGEILGSRRALTLIALLWGILNILIAVVPGPRLASTTVILLTLVGLRFLMGAAQAPLYPVMGGGAIYYWFPVSGWALPNGLTNAGLTLGSAVTNPLIAWLMETVGWRASFVWTAPLAFLLAGVWWWYVRDHPVEHSGVRPTELALINANRPPVEPTPSSGSGWGVVVRNRNVLLITASYFCSNYVFYFFFNWLFIYLVEVRQFKVMDSGYLSAAPWIAAAIGAVIGGLLCDRLSLRFGIRWGCRVPSIVGLLLTAGFIVAAAVAQSPYMAVVYLSLCLGCQQLTDSAAWAAAMSVAGRHASAACGVMNTGGNVVGGIGALLVPITARAFGWVAALATGSLFAIIGAVLWFWIRADQPIAEPAGPSPVSA